jgi:hypothetical protein
VAAVFLLLSCNQTTTPELLGTDFLSGAGKYFSVSADSIAYANQGFRVTVTAHFSGGSAVVNNYTGGMTFTVAGAGTISSATGGGWSNGVQTFTLVYNNGALSPGASTQIAIKAQAAGDASVTGTSNNMTMNGPLNQIETVWQENFDGGLSGWNLNSQPWITVASPSVSGSSLRSPPFSANGSYTMTTTAAINLSTKANCFIEYEIRFSVDGCNGALADIYFGANRVARYKDSTIGTSLVTSGLIFFPRKYFLGSNVTGNVSIVTQHGPTACGTSQIYVDDMRITCNHPTPSAVTVLSENFESGLGAWTVDTGWSTVAGQGSGLSTAAQITLAGNANASRYLRYNNNVSLVGRSGCQLRMWMIFTNASCGGFSTWTINWNNGRIHYVWDPLINATLIVPLTAYEGTATNQLDILCDESTSCSASGITCTADNVLVECQQ